MDAPKNIVLIVVDALRADHLGCYGYERETTPHLDHLASQGVLAERFFCAGIPTPPSFTTLFTGQHPITHGIVRWANTAPLPASAPFLTPLLLDSGYTTCAVDNLLRLRQWFARGCEFYIDPSLRHPLICAVTAEELNGRALPWIREHHDESFFLFIHYWDTHIPLQPPAKYRNLFYSGNPVDPDNHALDPWWENRLGLGALARDTWLSRPDGYATDPEYVVALYDQELRHVDNGIGELLATIDSIGQAEDTLVLVLADHGESMTEHGIFFEHHGLYDPVLRVPMIARWPGHIQAGRRLTQYLQHQDVAPTLLEAAGIDVPFEMDGESFLPLLTGSGQAAPERTRIYACEATWQAKWAVRTDTHKLIVAREPDMYGNPTHELFDLVADPGETHNLAQEQPRLTTELEADLEGWIGARLAESGRTEDPVRAFGTTLTPEVL